jgi:hypothetical protein
LGKYRDGSRFQELREAPFPRAAREFAGRTIDQTRDAYERCSRTLDAAVQILGTSFAAAGQGATALRRNFLDTAHRNLNLGFDIAKNLAATANLFEIVDLQAAYWQTLVGTFTTQAEEVRERQCKFGAPKKAEPSPLHNAPATKAPSLGHEKPKTGLDPATRDPERLKQSPITVRPSDETQSKTRKKSAVEVESRRRQRARLRLAAAEGGGQKPEPRSPSAVVAPPEARPPDERQSGTAKKSAVRDEAVQTSLAAGIKFGVLDGNPVRFTSLEAWWLVDGAWRPISPDEVLLNAAVMREARFNQFFPEVPKLPSNAFKSDKFQK